MTKTHISRDFQLSDLNSIALKFSAELKSMENSFADKKNTSFQLQQRVEALEDQNNQFLNFIHFLYENFPGFINNILAFDVINGVEMRKDEDKSGAGDQDNDVGMPLENQLPVPTRREIEIINLLVKGLCAKEIANRLFISETTVITHKKNLKKKFKVRNTVELIAKALISNRHNISTEENVR